MKSIVFNLQGFQEKVKDRLSLWQRDDFISRLQAKDPSLWFSSPQDGIVDRLGWLNLPEKMLGKLSDYYVFCENIKAESFSHVVLCGMGGSSLAPEVFRDIFGSASGHPELIVLDSTHPMAINAVEERINRKKPLFIISSKSGTTQETLSLFLYFWGKMASQIQSPGLHFVAITDRGSPLEMLASQRGFRKIIYAPSDLGGRYSALSDFGILPASLIGVDVQRLLEQAKFASQSCTEDEYEEKASCLFLGAFLGELNPERDKLTILTSKSLSRFSDWLEQLVAESTGKSGRGIVPVINEPEISSEVLGNDRYFVAFFLDDEKNKKLESYVGRIEQLGYPTVRIYLEDKYGIAQEIFRWEVAVALAGTVMGIHPFNQPDVQLTKELTRKILGMDGDNFKREAEGETLKIEDTGLGDKFANWISSTLPGDYICIQAFLPPFPEIEEAVQKIRKSLLIKTHLPTTFGFGPRYLHSTGQLHKGGPNSGLFLQMVDEPDCDQQVPERDYSFNSLIQAQAFGDFLSLKEKNKRILRVNLGANAVDSLHHLNKLVE